MADEKKGSSSDLESQTKKGKGDEISVAKVTAIGALLVAIVGAIATIVSAIIEHKPSSVVTPTQSSASLIFETAVFTPSYQSVSPTMLEKTLPSLIPTIPTMSPTRVMWMKANLDVQPRYEGKAPFRVTFNLENSKFQLANGDIVYCRNVGTCQFSLSIFRNGVVLEDFQNTKGIQVYTFIAPGIYNVTAVVCQGDVCDKADAEIVVK